MGRYLEMLLAMDANLQKPQTGNLQNPQNPKNEGSVGFEGAPPGHSQKLITPANDPAQPSTVTDRQRAFLKREPLVMLLARDANFQKAQTGNLQNHQNPEPSCEKGGSVGFEGTPPGTFEKIALTPIAGLPPRSVSLADLSRFQKRLLPHLAGCRDCVIEPHRYCATAEADGWAYQCLLTDCEDADQRHADFVSVVIQARIRGLQAGFTAQEALTRQEGDAGRETACRPVYGIDNRPAELAFVNHFTACAFCFPRSGKYCGEGRELHDLAMMETLQ